MQKVILVLVFVFSLFLKVAIAAGAEKGAAVVGAQKESEAGAEKGAAVAGVGEEPVTVRGKKVGVKKKTTTTTTEEFMDEEENANQMQEQKQSSKIENNIHLNSSQPVSVTTPVADAASVLGAKAYERNTQRISIIPMLGTGFFSGSWYNHVYNTYSMGLALDLPVTNHFSIEAEGGYGKYNVSYALYSHDFNQYTVGGSGKFYLSRSMIQPYLGLGMLAINFDNMSYGPAAYYQRYNRWMGAVQAMVGADVSISDQIAFGVRGAWLVPAVNRASVQSYGPYSLPYSEEAALMNTSQVRVMGTVRLAF